MKIDKYTINEIEDMAKTPIDKKKELVFLTQIQKVIDDRVKEIDLKGTPKEIRKIRMAVIFELRRLRTKVFS